MLFSSFTFIFGWLLPESFICFISYVFEILFITFRGFYLVCVLPRTESILLYVRLCRVGISFCETSLGIHFKIIFVLHICLPSFQIPCWPFSCSLIHVLSSLLTFPDKLIMDEGTISNIFFKLLLYWKSWHPYLSTFAGLYYCFSLS